MRIYPSVYLKKLRSLCDQTGVLLIADEIATGFGRTGKMFACDQAKIAPDIMCMSKGLTGGYLPMAVTAATEKIYNAFYADYSEGKALMHSHTYSGNPLGCAAALAVQKVLREDHILEKAACTGAYLHENITKRLLSHPNIGEIRHIGLINAMELVTDKEKKTGLNEDLRIGYTIYQKALQHGLILRPLGNILYFNPPLTITEEEIDEAVSRCATAIEEVL
jgi:adenosylmethionine-8-amino-7-oxononanoate aminotransferase